MGVHPTIFRGIDIIAFLELRNRARKQPCGPGPLFCFRCKAPKRPAFNEVEFWSDGLRGGKLRGLGLHNDNEQEGFARQAEVRCRRFDGFNAMRGRAPKRDVPTPLQ